MPHPLDLPKALNLSVPKAVYLAPRNVCRSIGVKTKSSSSKGRRKEQERKVRRDGGYGISQFSVLSLHRHRWRDFSGKIRRILAIAGMAVRREEACERS